MKCKICGSNDTLEEGYCPDCQLKLDENLTCGIAVAILIAVLLIVII